MLFSFKGNAQTHQINSTEINNLDKFYKQDTVVLRYDKSHKQILKLECLGYTIKDTTINIKLYGYDIKGNGKHLLKNIFLSKANGLWVTEGEYIYYTKYLPSIITTVVNLLEQSK